MPPEDIEELMGRLARMKEIDGRRSAMSKEEEALKQERLKLELLCLEEMQTRHIEQLTKPEFAGVDGKAMASIRSEVFTTVKDEAMAVRALEELGLAEQIAPPTKQLYDWNAARLRKLVRERLAAREPDLAGVEWVAKMRIGFLKPK